MCGGGGVLGRGIKCGEMNGQRACHSKIPPTHPPTALFTNAPKGKRHIYKQVAPYSYIIFN